MATNPPQQFCVRWNSYHTNLQAVFPRLLVTEQFADVTLACESRQLRCHKLVLSACSAYLERLLLQNPCKHPIVLMKDMRFSEMQALVDFMYKGEVNVTQEELPSLLKSAEALQIRGLCSNETGGLTTELDSKSDGKDYAMASEQLVAHARQNATPNGTTTQQKSILRSPSSSPNKKRKSSPQSDSIKEECVEEDGVYYAELDNDHSECNDDEDSGKPGSSLGQTSGIQNPYLRVKPESELFFQTKLQNLAKANSVYLNRLSKLSAADIKTEFSKYGINTNSFNDNYQEKVDDKAENDYYKSWLEQNGELEVSLLRASQVKKHKTEAKNQTQKSEVELIPKLKEQHVSLAKDVYSKVMEKPQGRRRGRPPIFKDKNVDIGDTVLKSDLDQFLEGKEVSSSGLSRKDLERVMMGKFNPNRRYSNEAMWAALMDVKKGGSIYRAAQTHKVPRKSLRNWMKRCHIKSSFPMPQQLKQFVENSKKQKEYKNFDYQNMDQQNFNDQKTVPETYDNDIEFDYAIANVQCQYDSGSEVDCLVSKTQEETRVKEFLLRNDDHTYDLRHEPPAFIIQQTTHHNPVTKPYVEPNSKFMTIEPLPTVSVIHVGDRPQVLNSHHHPPPSDVGMNKRIRRSEQVLREAAECVRQGHTFQTVSEQYNIPISTIRFFMARKGILPRRKRGRSTIASRIEPCGSPEPPFHMQHFKLPNMLALKSDVEDDDPPAAN